MSNTVDMVNAALDCYVQRVKDAAEERGMDTWPQFFTRLALVPCFNEVEQGDYVWTADDISTALQDYRYAQSGEEPLRYTIFCQGYAKQARWHIVTGPGIDPGKAEAVLMGHREYVVTDITERISRDLDHELAPAKATHPVLETWIDALIRQQVIDALTSLMSQVEMATDLFDELFDRDVAVEVAEAMTDEAMALIQEMV